ncbi:efflux RND transporter permease subunit [Paraliomyxa miuraensis]|uniref:efflux RND transporter permease subunit n=1 Tax=Paraliomyxa miuraensis TaxID=376150 RepID=UPI002254A84B|nr:MMPL family transporter [Paraliomyxa miuraensis]
MAGPKPLRGREPLSDRWIRWVLLRHRVILLAAAVLTLVASLFATRLQINGDLRVLLPPDHRVVRSLDQIESTFGSINSVNIVAKDGTPQARHAFTDALQARLQGHPLFRDVEHGLPSGFFSERGLYYLADAELDRLEQLVEAWKHYQLCSRQGDACLTEPDPRAPDDLRAFIDDKREQANARTGFRDRYEREGIEAEVMLVHPYEPANRLEVAQDVTHEIRGLAAEVFDRSDAPWAGTGMTYNITGPYITKADEQTTILRDMLRSGIFAFVGVVAILYFLFRSHRAVLVLLVPLLCGVVWSLGATQLVLGHLNVMTSTISTVVMGVGIDAGIHFFSRAKRARLEHDDGEAIRRAFDGLVIPLLVASSTTIGAFCSMASSEFPAFREFGIIAALGVALCLLSMVTVLPALCFLVGIKKREQHSREEPSLAARLVLARPGLMFIMLVAVSLVALQGARHVGFEYNGRSLQSDHARENTEPDAKLISSIFGKDIHAAVLVRPTLQEARATLELARARHAERVAADDTVVAELFGVTDLLPDPTIDMQARARWIARFSAEHGELVDELRERAGLPPREPSQGTKDGDWDDWDDDGAAGSGGTPAPPAPHADDWDEWDGSDDEPGAPSPSPGAPDPASPAPAMPSPAAPDPAAPAPSPAAPAPPPGAEPPEPAAPAAEPEELSKEDAELLLAMLDAKPFTVDDLPETLLAKVRASDGSYGLFAYPAFDVADMQRGLVFMDETSSYLDDPESGTFVGEAVVYAAMYLMLREEAPVVLGMAAILIAVLVFWQLRSIPLMLMTLVPLLLAMAWLLGVMGAIDMRFTLFNLPILPAILGIGVDNGVYLTDRIRRAPATDEGLVDALHETGGAILAATATTAVGFAAFMVADSGGVRGIGSLAVLGIVLAALAALLVLPTITALVQRRLRR